jgi:anti-sigma regulatory factor (Ser/Thr protein kinase)
VRELLQEWSLPALADDAALVVSELVTNALRSPRENAGSTCMARLWLSANPASLAILVCDGTSSAPRRPKSGPDDESGRGLVIVDALSARWGWSPLPDQSGKVVWALFNTHPESSLEIPMQEGGLFAFERTNLEKLRLACQVILDQAGEHFISDPLEAELYGLRDQIDRVLLLPDRPTTVA